MSTIFWNENETSDYVDDKHRGDSSFKQGIEKTALL